MPACTVIANIFANWKKKTGKFAKTEGEAGLGSHGMDWPNPHKYEET